jgi:hypothetical protein
MACMCFMPVVGRGQTAAPKAPATKKPSGTKSATSKNRSFGKSAGNHPQSTGSAAARSKSKHRTSAKITHTKRTRGQQKIDPERAQAIQEALIREHYMSGDPAGTWNQASEDALRRYQADHGWQSKTVPDSRALISLGLGPSHDHLLNPESAMTSVPDVSHSASASSTAQIPASHSASPASNSPTPAAATPAASPDPDGPPRP